MLVLVIVLIIDFVIPKAASYRPAADVIPNRAPGTGETDYEHEHEHERYPYVAIRRFLVQLERFFSYHVFEKLLGQGERRHQWVYREGL